MEEQNGNNVIKINLMQVSMTLGTYLGLYIILAYAITVLSVKFNALSMLAMPLILGIPVIAYLLIRHFRETNCKPFFPFPVSWMISILTFLFATMLSCMAAYLYLRFIDNGAFAAGMMERMDMIMTASGTAAQELTDPAQAEQYNSAMELFRQTVTWFCSLPASGMTKQLVQTSLMWGNILSLIIAIITAKRIRLKQE
jgi:hypothetical protein